MKPVIVKQWAEFTTDLPDDEIEGSGEVGDVDYIQYGGKSVIYAIAEMLTGLGCNVNEPFHAHEHGWQMTLSIGKRRLFAQVTLIDRYLFLLEQNSWFANKFGRQWPEYLDIIKRLSVELANDPRFHGVGWFSPKEILLDRVGATSPVPD